MRALPAHGVRRRLLTERSGILHSKRYRLAPTCPRRRRDLTQKTRLRSETETHTGKPERRRLRRSLCCFLFASFSRTGTAAGLH